MGHCGDFYGGENGAEVEVGLAVKVCGPTATGTHVLPKEYLPPKGSEMQNSHASRQSHPGDWRPENGGRVRRISSSLTRRFAGGRVSAAGRAMQGCAVRTTVAPLATHLTPLASCLPVPSAKPASGTSLARLKSRTAEDELGGTCIAHDEDIFESTKGGNSNNIVGNEW